ncbi:hypothetical protein GE253_21530 [Niveispirillum sp. SYP-B3756]|uniref:hypothetical protein n=1 Tax=Niveispirillum sp. SYP-B3756 TaxID=2662178 RepID=UPI001291C0F4|nr:hypothetical protein [Niveispirillum sp. SYP-B3756]MQP67903.1 hypothetical protein [Niveispirillum sp. SYP-B3756]
MPIRTTEMTVTFERPFALASFDRLLPVGMYLLEIDEEEISSLSFSAYRRTSARLHTPAIGVLSSIRQVLPIDTRELEAVLKADCAPIILPAGE